ncbi:FkbM family methyltransferase [Halotia branconii]|uniref:FkbM family methyltransferase n=1 Tax=Halotia branconii CENA392 TaxID=1539056 RepID=A0AAJ6PCT7_9CYAN|nr:FkbM family methyltransferase [Halotia branconii]WGV29221.1 FkbM family methyltransferase [Halotia branconii CENA392]
MKVALRNSLAYFLRSLPYFRGKYRLSTALVPLMTNYQIDEDCLVQIKMQDDSIIHLDLRSILEQKVFFSGEYDSGIMQMLSSILYPGIVIFDVGANIGLYSISLGKKLKQIDGNSQIWAFEPVSSNFNRLANLVKVNQLTNIVYPVNTALGNQEETIQLCMVDEKNNSSTGNAFLLKESLINQHKPTCSSPITKLDNLVEKYNISKCDIIKVDIEGAEMDFVLGGMNFLKKSRPIIYGEFNPYWVKHFGYSFVDVAELIIPLKYKLYQQVGRRNFVEIKEIKADISDVLMVPTEKLPHILSKLNIL